jgi:replication factor A1
MYSLVEIISNILINHRDLTEERILDLIEKKKEEAGGLLTPIGAAYLVANDLGIILSSENIKSDILIKDLINGLNDVTLTGRVLLVQPVQTFKKSDGSIGKVQRLIIADKTGSGYVVLWDEHTSVVNQSMTNQIIRISHGYTRAGIVGKPELNLSTRGDIIVSPTDIKPVNYPETQDFFKKINELKKEELYINMVGTVRKISPINTFIKSDQTQGRLVKVNVSDNTGIITVLFWNDNVDQISRLKQGSILKIIGASLRKGIDEKLELNIGRYTITEIKNEKSSDHELKKYFKINQIVPDLQNINLVARVVYISEKKKFKRFNKKNGQRMNLLLRDETGYIRLTLWDEKADVIGISIGDTVLIKGSYPRSGYRRVDLNLGISGNVIINPKISETKSLPPPISILPIKDVQENLSFASIEGVIIESSSSNEVITRYGKTVTVSNVKIGDDSGEIRVSLWNTLANYIVELPSMTKIRIKNAYIKKGLNGDIQLSSGYPTSIEIVSNQTNSDN